MNTVTLQGEDFKVLHNTLWELDRLDDPRVNSLVERIRTVALKDAYAQDDRQFQEKNDHYDFIALKAGIRVSRWSIYEVMDMEAAHPYPGALQLCYKDHWGEQGPVYREIKGTRWRDLWKAADLAIEDSGDLHHIFIEAFTMNPKVPEQLWLTTGS